MQLTELIGRFPTFRRRGVVDRLVSAVTRDVQSAGPGVVFVSFPEERARNPYAAIAAADRGAAAVICEPGMRLPYQRIPCIQVQDSRAAYAHVAAALVGNPSRQLRVIGVHGERASATAYLLRQFFEHSDRRCGLLGSHGCFLGDRYLPKPVATCDARDIQDLFVQLQREQVAVCLFEMSAELAASEAIVAVDFERQLTASSRNRSTSRSMMTQGELTARHLSLGSGGTTFQLEHEGASVAIRTPVLGRLNVRDLLIAAEMAFQLGFTLADIQRTFSRLEVVPGLREPVRVGQDFIVAIDGARYDTELAGTLNDIREITRGQLRVVVGTGQHHAPWQRVELGRVAGGLADELWLTSDDPYDADPEVLCAEVQNGVQMARDGGVSIEIDRARAISTAIQACVPGDSVVIAGKGARRLQMLDRVIVPWDDRDHALAGLERCGFLRMPV